MIRPFFFFSFFCPTAFSACCFSAYFSASPAPPREVESARRRSIGNYYALDANLKFGDCHLFCFSCSTRFCPANPGWRLLSRVPGLSRPFFLLKLGPAKANRHPRRLVKHGASCVCAWDQAMTRDAEDHHRPQNARNDMLGGHRVQQNHLARCKKTPRAATVP